MTPAAHFHAPALIQSVAITPPARQVTPSYFTLIERFGRLAFSIACAQSKHSPLSVEEILKRNAAAEQSKQ